MQHEHQSEAGDQHITMLAPGIHREPSGIYTGTGELYAETYDQHGEHIAHLWRVTEQQARQQAAIFCAEYLELATSTSTNGRTQYLAASPSTGHYIRSTKTARIDAARDAARDAADEAADELADEAADNRYEIIVSISGADETYEHTYREHFAYRADAEATAEYIYDGGAGAILAARVIDTTLPAAYRTVSRIDADGFISYEPETDISRDDLARDHERINREILDAIQTGAGRSAEYYRDLETERERIEHAMFTHDHGPEAADQIIGRRP